MKIFYKLFLIVSILTSSLLLAAPALAVPSAPQDSELSVSRIIPDILDNQTVYPAVPATLDLDPLQIYRWEKVILPEAWANAGYYIEVWDTNNQPIPAYAAQRLTSDELDIRDIDATLHPKIRIILFRPVNAPEVDYTEPVYYQYHTNFNTQLVAFAVIVLLVLAALLLGAAYTKLRFKDLVSGTLDMLRGHTENRFSTKGMVISGLLVLTWSGWFGVVLGTYVGGVQVFYLLIKTPFMLLISLFFSVLAIGVLSLLLGVKASVKELFAQALSSLAAMSLAMAAFTPLILFYIWLPQTHDQLLISTVAFFVLSGAIAGFTVYRWLRGYTRWALVIALVWIALYGVVVLQLGWLLRPWVGILDPIHGSVPFSRFYSGNVFIELIQTILRLHL